YIFTREVFRLFAKTWLSYRVYGREHVKGLDDAGYVVASNHVSFLDPPMVGSGFREPVYFFARKTLFDHPFFGWYLKKIQAIPVNQEKPELASLKLMIDLLKKDEKVVIFPEGERAYDGKLKEQGQSGVGMIVAKSKAKVVPCRIFGAEKAMPRGSSKVLRHPVSVVFGEPYDVYDLIENKDLGNKERYEAITERIMESIRQIEPPNR
ncbi:MAG: lysophospholipid acyltransferase family protein, partial [Verrucomicrobiota bacterium]